MMNIAFIGLGHMGKGMAKSLIASGQSLTLFNRTPGRIEDLRSDRVQIARSPAEAVKEADILITMVADDAALESILFGEKGAMQALRPGATHIAMSTISVSLSQRLAQMHAQASHHYLAAPVFGRPDSAAAAKLWIVCAGPEEQIKQCKPLLEKMAQGVFVVGSEAPNAHVIKLAGNFLIASVLESLGEAFSLIRKSGINPELFLEIANTALFKSPLYENYGKMIAQERYEPAGFKLQLGLKDLTLISEAAKISATPMPLASLIQNHFLSGIANGKADQDWSALGEIIARNAGLSQGERKRT